MGLFSPNPSREKRPTCRQCGGLGSYIETTHHKIKNRDGSKSKIIDKERVRCSKCKGSGYR